MEIMDALKTRRSIRKYTEEKIPDEILMEILDAAMMAPSAGDARPWEFIVIRDKEILSKVKSINPYAGMAALADTGVLVCGNLKMEKHQGFFVQDCSAAVMNILLAAHGKGVGGLWTGVYPLEERVKGFQKLLDIPDHVIPVAFVLLGYPAKAVKSESRFDMEKIHFDGWGKK